MKCLKPTIQNKKFPKVFGFDCETYGKYNDFYCCSIVGEDYQKTFFDKEEFITTLQTDHRFRNCRIVATNLHFDFFCIFRHHSVEKNMDILPRGSEIIQAIWRFGHGYRIIFIGTENYTGRMSVERLGNIVGVPKLEHPSFIGKIPKNEKEKQELVIYNLRDAEISYKATLFLFKKFFELGANLKSTIASTAMSLFTNKYLKKTIFQHDPEILKTLLKSYYGGRTECFKRGKIENVNYYDVNSLYPFCMLNEFPDPNSQRYTRRGSIELIKKFHGVSFVKIYASRFLKLYLLPVRHDDKLTFSAGDYSGYYTHIELREALKLGYDIEEIGESYYYPHVCYPFKDYVNTLYALRLKYKAENNPAELPVKLLMNSLYGKFAQKFMEKSVMKHKDSGFNPDEYDSIEEIEDYFRCCKNEVAPAKFCIPIWASYVTSYARIHLYNILFKCDPYYCDTDSIITKSELKTGKELGQLKLEAKIKSGYIVKPKFYEYIKDDGKIERRLKGVPSRFVLPFKELLFGNKKKATIKIQLFTKFLRSLRSVNKLKVNEIVDTIKSVDFEDTKRKWKKHFNPEELQESEVLVINT